MGPSNTFFGTVKHRQTPSNTTSHRFVGNCSKSTGPSSKGFRPSNTVKHRQTPSNRGVFEGPARLPVMGETWDRQTPSNTVKQGGGTVKQGCRAVKQGGGPSNGTYHLLRLSFWAFFLLDCLLMSLANVSGIC